jgi:undecaprenyl phosphate-alpha-L-ara4N flippase subunit ArnF
MLLVSISVVLVSIAQLLLKFGAVHAALLHDITAMTEVLNAQILWSLALPIAVGLLCYMASMFVWLRALGELPLSVAYPLLSLSYPLVYIAALLLPGFDETLSTNRIAGLLLTIVGIALLSPHTIKNESANDDNSPRV